MADEDAVKIRSQVKTVFARLYDAATAAVDEAKRRQETMAATMTPAELALERQLQQTDKWLEDAKAKVD